MNQKQFLINPLDKITDKLDVKEASFKQLHTKCDNVCHQVIVTLLPWYKIVKAKWNCWMQKTKIFY